MAITPEEKQEIIKSIKDEVLSAIRTNSRTIPQLTRVRELQDEDLLEVNGGKMIYASDLYKQLKGPSSVTLQEMLGMNASNIVQYILLSSGEPQILTVNFNSYAVGILYIITDPATRSVTQVFTTALTLKDGSFDGSFLSAHDIGIYFRTLNRSTDTWSGWVRLENNESGDTSGLVNSFRDLERRMKTFEDSKGNPNGVAPLASDKQIPEMYVPENVMYFNGFVDIELNEENSTEGGKVDNIEDIKFNIHDKMFIMDIGNGRYNTGFDGGEHYGTAKQSKGYIPFIFKFYFDVSSDTLYYAPYGSSLLPIPFEVGDYTGEGLVRITLTGDTNNLSALTDYYTTETKDTVVYTKRGNFIGYARYFHDHKYNNRIIRFWTTANVDSEGSYNINNDVVRVYEIYRDNGKWYKWNDITPISMFDVSDSINGTQVPSCAAVRKALEGYIKNGNDVTAALRTLSLTDLNYSNILTILHNGATIASFDGENVTFNLPLSLPKKPVGEGIEELKKDIIKNLPSQACVIKAHYTTPPDSYYRIENSDEELKEMASAIFGGDKLRADANIILQVDGKNHHMSDLSLINPTGSVYMARAIFLETVQHTPYGNEGTDSLGDKTGLLGYYVLTISNNPTALGTRVEYFEIEQSAYKPPYLELTLVENFNHLEPFTVNLGGQAYKAIDRAFQNSEPLAVRVYAKNGSRPHLTSAEVQTVTTDRPNYQIYISYCGVPYVSDLINESITEVLFTPVSNAPTGYEQFLVKS